jgi:predicted GNAT superfamily acetyltransferase
MTQPDDLQIRRADTPADYRACQEAQRLAWGITEDSYVVPIATLAGANLHGGLVLGAFRPDGTAAGLSFGFLGRVGGRVGLYSQLTGIVPQYQSKGLGYRLKQEQFAFARAEALPFVAWAFDPLQAGNARFNLDKLGASAVSYIDDMYGPRSDALNAGVPTDRVLAVWEAQGPPRPSFPPADDLPRLVACGPTIDDAPLCSPLAALPDASIVVVEFPSSISDLRARHPAAADRWRLVVRGALREAFDAGYSARSVWRPTDPAGPHRCGYLLGR